MEETFLSSIRPASGQVVNAHILHNKTSKQKMLLEIFYEKFAEELLASVGMEIQLQG
jgi:hypothetical protein